MRLQARLEQEVENRHWGLTVNHRLTPPLIEGAISTRDWRIIITLDPEGPERLATLLSTSQTEGERLWEQMGTAVLRHEMGHWDHCPFSGEWNAAILEGISQALKRRGYRHREAVVHRMANFFCDLVVNATLASWDRESFEFTEGVATFLVKEWARAEPEGGLSEEYRVFLGTSAGLLPRGGPMGQRLRGILRDEKDQRVRRAIAALGRILLGDEASLGEPLTQERIAKILLQREQWGAKARRAAAILAEFVRDDSSRWIMSTDVIAGGFSRGPGFGPDAGAEDQDVGEEGDSGGPGGTGGIGRQLPRPPFPGALEDLYRARAAKIVLEFDRGRSGAQEYPVAYLRTRRLFEMEPAAPSEIRWARTRFVPTGPSEEEAWLYRKEVPRSSPLSRPGHHRVLPDLAFLVDSSGSMRWEPYSGSGEFDLLLRTIYSVFRWLESHRVAYYLRYAAINFSSRSLFSGWRRWDEIGSLKRILLAHQGHGTVLDEGQLQELCRQAHRQFGAIMVTDGEIRNADRVLAALKIMLSEGHRLVLIQIGKETRFARGAKNLGAEMHLLDSAAGLPGLVLGRVQQQYGSRL